jgi:hypothetical protein
VSNSAYIYSDFFETNNHIYDYLSQNKSPYLFGSLDVMDDSDLKI